jgi:hypothetical protein
MHNLAKFLCLLAFFKLSLTQFADESVKEFSTYQQIVDPEINNKYDLNTYFNSQKVVETLISQIYGQQQQVYNGQTGVTPQHMLHNTFRSDEKVSNITYQAKVAFRVGNKIAKELV